MESNINPEENYGKLNLKDPIDREASRIFHITSYFALGSSVSPSLLYRANYDKKGDPSEDKNFTAALERLSELSLIQRSDERILLPFYAQQFAADHLGPNQTKEKATNAVEKAIVKFTDENNARMDPRLVHPELGNLRYITSNATKRNSEHAGWLNQALGFHIYIDKGDLREAQSYLEKALQIDEKVLGPEHEDIPSDLNVLGMILRKQGYLEEAMGYLERAVNIRKKTKGENHPSIAEDYNEIGSVLLWKEDFKNAKHYFEMALGVNENTDKPNLHRSATLHNNIGKTSQDLGDLEGARSHYEQALKIAIVEVGVDHPSTIIFRNNLESLVQIIQAPQLSP